MQDYRDYFKNKKITLLGLGLLGRGVNVAKFLAECGAELTVTDLKTEEQLASSIDELKQFSGIQYVLGEHRLEDFQHCDMVIKAAGVPLDSPFIAEARKNNIPVKMDASLFVELAPEGVTTIGVTGTRGKSTVSQMIYETLQAASKSYKLKAKSSRVYLGGNVRGQATLPFLKTIKSGDIVVLELDSWQLQGFADAGTSPDIAVFTTFFDDHLNYYDGDRDLYLQDKAAIFLNQHPHPSLRETERSEVPKQSRILQYGKKPVFIIGEQAYPLIEQTYREHAERAIVVSEKDFPESWQLAIPGVHNRYNAACALTASDALDVDQAVTKQVLERFHNLPGRLEYIGEKNDVKIYNDNNATTPDATIAALRAVGDSARKNVVLIMGGADKNLDMSTLLAEIPKCCKAIVLLDGTGTHRIKNQELRIKNGDQNNQDVSSVFNASPVYDNLKDAVNAALVLTAPGDTLLFSPAFASFGMFKNEYDRGDQFKELIQNI